MPDLVQDIPFTHDHELREGDVALIFQADGDIRLAHNIAKVRETNIIKGEDTGGFILALSLLTMVDDTPAFNDAMKRAGVMLEQLTLPSPQSVRN